ncbi:hypothetical protein LTS08_004905 [Lithohypha guttulata]|uniref:Uncharacterized protein n=1 Tax=Lithohypha guttulata TaxID=1690604 RepID=A0AAN7YIQ5_9EURO|nr:hypothetical protein LTR51_005294 [Lithohypha guttulata]KAK5088034.1 hypothetical protein LTR05_002250 [Lithohypha guttulata]KAK5101298.1 hypothetical protein LTS08_004905 [Lithohypha guttulata]
MESFLKMLRITNAPTVPAGDDENTNDVDEPPDDRVPELRNNFKKENSYRSSAMPSMIRRESLLTRAIQAENGTPPPSTRIPEVLRGLSTTSSHSFASTAELTSDAESPIRSASPSPPPPLHRLQITTSTKPVESAKVVIAPLANEDKPVVLHNGEAAVEKSLGRKRCIMFACKDTPSDSQVEADSKQKSVETPKQEPAPRKCRISFACPTQSSTDIKQAEAKKDSVQVSQVTSPQVPLLRVESKTQLPKAVMPLPSITVKDERNPLSPGEKPSLSPQQSFHEFASPHAENEEWVEKTADVVKPKLTIEDCLKKENAIRKLGEEAEEEADEEEREQDELENEVDDEDEVEDDFAPSDDDTPSNDGNESDDEEGFAESDDEDDAGSEYQFWAPFPASNKASVDAMPYFSARQRSRSRASSTSSAHSLAAPEPPRRPIGMARPSKPIRMRPGTPELPDSTDFVCGTLDEDRPLEAAYISCREQRRREKHIPIPQDIDPSFPTTDPEDQEDDEEDVADSSDHMWVKHQFEGFDEDVRGRRPSAILVSPVHSPVHAVAPPRPARPANISRPTLRSPPPKQKLSRSPAPRRLFDQTHRRMRSPPPTGRLHSPRGSPTNFKPAPFGITINHLAQRPNADKTSSLPHTPNPFFRNWRNVQQPFSRIPMAAVPAGDETSNDLHVRGPVDIVIGLEKKRQKRKEKYWRQHCRKAAKEQAVKRPPPGRGVERMKELGLECAERSRGYGLGQPAQLVLSL